MTPQEKREQLMLQFDAFVAEKITPEIQKLLGTDRIMLALCVRFQLPDQPSMMAAAGTSKSREELITLLSAFILNMAYARPLAEAEMGADGEMRTVPVGRLQ